MKKIEAFLLWIAYMTGLASIAFVLFVFHAKQLQAMDAWNEVQVLKFASFDLRQFALYATAFMFAITTTNIIALLKVRDWAFWIFIFVIAFMEAMVVQLFTNTEIAQNWWRILSAWYYSIYVAVIIIMYAYIKKLKDGDSNEKQPMQSKSAKRNLRKQSQALAQVPATYTPATALPIKDRDNVILDLNSQGLSNTAIAEQVEVHPSTVGRVLKKNGIFND